jgi:hypothetical protein
VCTTGSPARSKRRTDKTSRRSPLRNSSSRSRPPPGNCHSPVSGVG